MQSQPPTPNFFIVGAPKCATTALSTYLREHPSVFLCDPKEPCFWSDDMPGIRASHGIATVDEYLHLFDDADERHLAIGEGSTNYLVSENAVAKIMRFNSEARIIVMLRNPVDLVHSLHTHNHFSGWDPEPDVAVAWSMQAERRSNTDLVPKACLNPTMLQYKEVGSLGTQLQRTIGIVPSDQLLILLHDDFRRSPRDTYVRVLSFLDLPEDHRIDFPAVNEAMAPRIESITRLMQTAPMRIVTRTLKRTLRGPLYKLADRAKKSLSMKSQAKAPLDRAFRQKLQDEFAIEVKLLEQLLDRDLASWRTE